MSDKPTPPGTLPVALTERLTRVEEQLEDLYHLQDRDGRLYSRNFARCEKLAADLEMRRNHIRSLKIQRVTLKFAERAILGDQEVIHVDIDEIGEPLGPIVRERVGDVTTVPANDTTRPKDVILSVLQQAKGPMMLEEIKNKTGLRGASIGTCLRYLVEERRVVQPTKGQWEAVHAV